MSDKGSVFDVVAPDTKITVETKSRKDNNNGYKFDISLSDKFVEISIDNNLNFYYEIEYLRFT